jgi:hypothetical protein
MPVARGYLNRHSDDGNGETIKDLLKVWSQQLIRHGRSPSGCGRSSKNTGCRRISK